MSVHQLRLGDLILSDGGDPNPNGTPYTFEVLGSDDEFTLGNAEPIDIEVRSLLQDGSIVDHDRDDNREPALDVVISAPDSGTLAQGVAALIAELYKPNELGWTPSDGYSQETVYDVVTSSLTRVEGELEEVRESRRRYHLNIVAQPFGRPNTMTVTPAVPASVVTPTSTQVSAGDSTTGWSTTYGTLADKGDHLEVTGTRTPRPTYTPTTAVNTSAQSYVSLAMWLESAIANGNVMVSALDDAPALYVNGVQATLVGSTGSGTMTRYTWKTGVASATSFLFATNTTTFDKHLNVRSLQVANVPPFSGTARQTLRTVAVDGTARAPGSFAIGHDTMPLGTVLLYTCESAYSPTLRPYRAGPATPLPTTDSALISGARDNIDGSVYFDIPVQQLIEGKHQILARLRSDTSGTQSVTWAVQTRTPAGAVGDAQTGVMPCKFVGANVWATYLIGNAQLLTVDTPPNSTATVRVTLAATDATASNIDLDEGWVFNMDRGALSWLEVGTNQRVWIDTATPDHPRPGVYTGSAVDRSDAVNPGRALKAHYQHQFVPPVASVFVSTSGATYAQATFSYYPRSHYEVAPSSQPAAIGSTRVPPR